MFDIVFICDLFSCVFGTLSCFCFCAFVLFIFAIFKGGASSATTTAAASATREQVPGRGRTVQGYAALPGDEALVEAHRRVQESVVPCELD